MIPTTFDEIFFNSSNKIDKYYSNGDKLYIPVFDVPKEEISIRLSAPYLNINFKAAPKSVYATMLGGNDSVFKFMIPSTKKVKEAKVENGLLMIHFMNREEDSTTIMIE